MVDTIRDNRSSFMAHVVNGVGNCVAAAMTTTLTQYQITKRKVMASCVILLQENRFEPAFTTTSYAADFTSSRCFQACKNFISSSYCEQPECVDELSGGLEYTGCLPTRFSALVPTHAKAFLDVFNKTMHESDPWILYRDGELEPASNSCLTACQHSLYSPILWGKTTTDGFILAKTVASPVITAVCLTALLVDPITKKCTKRYGNSLVGNAIQWGIGIAVTSSIGVFMSAQISELALGFAAYKTAATCYQVFCERFR